jgi:hypothetical protein
MPKRQYKIEIISPFFTTKNQIWSWSGQMKGDNKCLWNVQDFTSDCRLLLNKDDKVVGGYSFLFNDQNTLNVTEIEPMEIKYE